MQERTRTTVFIGLGLFFVALLGIWWYFGFSLEFMRFFAAEPGPAATDIIGCVAPAGCTCQVVQCIQAPCDPVVVCPAATCRPYPSCLLPGANPACSVVEPPEGWCPQTTGKVECSPATQTVRLGDRASLTASNGVAPYAWFAPEGMQEVANGALFSVSYGTIGTKKVTVQASRAVGVNDPTNPIIDSIACAVVVTP